MEPCNSRLGLNKRVIGIPGHTVVGRKNSVYVNGRKADDIPTVPFPPGSSRREGVFWSMGDSRIFSQDSRDFGPYPGEPSAPRAVLIVWPLDRFGVPGYNKLEVPPGDLCGYGSFWCPSVRECPLKAGDCPRRVS